MSDIIDLTETKTKKASKKSSKKASKTAAKKTSKKAPSKKTVSKKTKVKTERVHHTADTVGGPVKKAFAKWKTGTSLAELCRDLDLGRNSLWIQFRALAGGDDALHRLRVKGAGVPRGVLRFGAAKPTKSKGKKGKKVAGKKGK